jgi:hypothetical protein
MLKQKISTMKVLRSLRLIFIIAFIYVLGHPNVSNVIDNSTSLNKIGYCVVKGEYNLNDISSTLPDPEVVEHLEDTRTEEERNEDNAFFNALRVQELYPDVELSLILAIIQKESHYNPTVNGSGAIGLMQVIPSCHTDRISRLGVSDIWDPYSNILVGTDLINDLLKIYKDPGLALMCYNMGEGNALYKYNNHGYSGYALEVLSIKKEIERSERYATYSHQAEKAGSDSRDS